MQKIPEIQELFAEAGKEQWNALFSQYETDSRVGVQKIVEQYRKKLAAIEREDVRLEKMLSYEKKYGQEYSCICGIDEAGSL